MVSHARGMQQVALYNSSATPLYAVVTDDLGRMQKSDAAPQITIYNPAGTQLVGATAMTAYSSTTEGYLAYDAQTAEFAVGETLTGGTSTATALIVDQVRTGTTGVLRLADIAGTFQDNETITDSGSGSATANGTLYQSEYYYNLATTTTSSYSVGKNYSAKISYAISSKAYIRWLYFDVAHFPATGPWVTSQDVVRRWPHLIGAVPVEWPDWQPAILAAHADLIRRLHSLGEQAAFFVKRGEEMWGIEMMFIRREIAQALAEPLENIQYWEKRAEDAWAARGEFTYDADDDQAIDSDVKVISSGFTR